MIPLVPRWSLVHGLGVVLPPRGGQARWIRLRLSQPPQRCPSPIHSFLVRFRFEDAHGGQVLSVLGATVWAAVWGAPWDNARMYSRECLFAQNVIVQPAAGAHPANLCVHRPGFWSKAMRIGWGPGLGRESSVAGVSWLV